MKCFPLPVSGRVKYLEGGSLLLVMVSIWIVINMGN